MWHQCCDDAWDTVSLTTMESLENGVATHVGVTPLWSMRAVFHADAWCKCTRNGSNSISIKHCFWYDHHLRNTLGKCMHVHIIKFHEIIKIVKFVDNIKQEELECLVLNHFYFGITRFISVTIAVLLLKCSAMHFRIIFCSGKSDEHNMNTKVRFHSNMLTMWLINLWVLQWQWKFTNRFQLQSPLTSS